jgi:hypothetical protein
LEEIAVLAFGYRILVGFTSQTLSRLRLTIRANRMRDFYTHILAASPSISMIRPFQGKFQDIKWETNEIETAFEA